MAAEIKGKGKVVQPLLLAIKLYRRLILGLRLNIESALVNWQGM